MSRAYIRHQCNRYFSSVCASRELAAGLEQGSDWKLIGWYDKCGGFCALTQITPQTMRAVDAAGRCSTVQSVSHLKIPKGIGDLWEISLAEGQSSKMGQKPSGWNYKEYKVLWTGRAGQEQRWLQQRYSATRFECPKYIKKNVFIS